MNKRVPRQKIIRFNNPKYSDRDKDIWPWIMAQGKHVTRSLHLLINVAQAENGNVDYTKAVIKRAIMNQSHLKSRSSNSHQSGISNIRKSKKRVNVNKSKHPKPKSEKPKSKGPTKMTHNQLKNAFLN